MINLTELGNVGIILAGTAFLLRVILDQIRQMQKKKNVSTESHIAPCKNLEKLEEEYHKALNEIRAFMNTMLIKITGIEKDIEYLKKAADES